MSAGLDVLADEMDQEDPTIWQRMAYNAVFGQLIGMASSRRFADMVARRPSFITTGALDIIWAILEARVSFPLHERIPALDPIKAPTSLIQHQHFEVTDFSTSLDFNFLGKLRISYPHISPDLFAIPTEVTLPTTLAELQLQIN
jgi:hypothetical protein